MSKVFISYSREDNALVKKITQALSNNNVDVWIDWEDISPASDWLSEIYQGIEVTDTVIYIVTPYSLASKICKQEIEYATKNGKRIIPVIAKKVNQKKSEILESIQEESWIYLDETKGGFNKTMQLLIEAISIDIKWVQFLSRLQVRALEWERNDKNISLLLRNKELQEVKHQIENSIEKSPKLTELQLLYIRTSENYSTQRRRYIIILIVIATITFFTAGIFTGFFITLPQFRAFGWLVFGFVISVSVTLIFIVLHFRNELSSTRYSEKLIPDTDIEKPDLLLPETIFISYKKDDWDEFVRPLVVSLRRKGFKVWIDQSGLEVGKNWMDEINRALKICQRLVLCVSPTSLNSDYVKMEYRYFFHTKKTIFPIECIKTEMPAELLGIQNIPFSRLDILADKLKDVGRFER